MQNNKLLTIVIPAYNMENYLHRCLDSIIVESVMGRVQVIVVNDGSKDKTSEIAHEYENKYPHYIQVIDKENGNYGSCMNMGLSLAKGKYFRTLDADDWYDSEAYEKFVAELDKTDADMLLTERKGYHEDTGIKDSFLFDSSILDNCDMIINEDLWNLRSINKMIHVSAVSYKTVILKNSNLIWDSNVFYTDNEFLLWPLCMVKTIRVFHLPVYVYLSGREGQSVNPNNLHKNWYSWLVVSRSLLKQVLKPNYKNSVNYPLIKRCLKVDVLPHFYRTLLYDGLKNQKIVREIDSLVQADENLYAEVGTIDSFRGHFFIEEFRRNMFSFLCTRLDYRLRTNPLLRRAFMKKIYCL